MTAAPQASDADRIEIRPYEDWMSDQVAAMFVAQYGGEPAEQAEAYQRFYEAPFQRPHGIRLVAVEGDTVCGFQSYFYWPYVLDGRRFRTFQSGNSLVSPAYRGRGIFGRLLGHLDRTEGLPGVDFLVGFPVEMSYGSFIRNGWANPLDLAWHARPIRPLSLLANEAPSRDRWRFDTAPEPIGAVEPAGCFSLSREPELVAWRHSLRQADSPHMYFHHRERGATIRFALKANRRGRINELVIGDVAPESGDPALLRDGLRALVRAARGHRFLTLLSVALNPHERGDTFLRTFRRRGFLPIRKRIHFIVKPVRDIPEALDPTRWHLMSGDIDTW